MQKDKRKALIIDDNWTCLTKSEIILKKTFQCETASNGFEGFLKFCQGLKKNEPFDLILLDINMPEMNGIHVLEAIREIEGLVNIPAEKQAKIVMVTASDESGSIFSSFKKGCESYVVKPYTEQRLFGELEKMGLIDGVKV